MADSQNQVPGQAGGEVPAKKGNNPTGKGGFQKGRSGRYVPIEEHKAVLERLAELEGKTVEEVSRKANPEVVRLEAELAEALGRLEDQGVKGELKALRLRNAELEKAAAERAVVVEGGADPGTEKALEQIEAILKDCAAARAAKGE